MYNYDMLNMNIFLLYMISRSKASFYNRVLFGIWNKDYNNLKVRSMVMMTVIS